MTQAHTQTLGYPRIGEQRELKRATESYWKGQLSLEQLEDAGRQLRATNWLKQKHAGIELIPCNDFSFYDQMLDMTCLVGNVPPRFGWQGEMVDLDTRFLIARGTRSAGAGEGDAPASDMTKWFDTNYHYIVPEFHAGTRFRLAATKVFDELAEAKALGINAKPVLIGPVTYLTLGKVEDPEQPDFDRMTLIDQLLPVYEAIVSRLANEGAEWIQIDEPVLALDLSAAQRSAISKTFERLSLAVGESKLMVATYFGELRENLALLLGLPVAAVHVDVVRGVSELNQLLASFPSDKQLSLGVVDGRNIWKNDFDVSLEQLRRAEAAMGAERLWVAPSCSLMHSPITLANEPALDAELKSWMAYADQKLDEVVALRDILAGTASESLIASNRAAQAARKASPKIHAPSVKARVAGVKAADFDRLSSFTERQRLQRSKLNLPLFPTTTIGSFPQTAEVRAARAKWKRGDLSDTAYDAFLKEEIKRCVEFQEEAGIDMPVHGEFERNDMVEYFGEQLEGYGFTTNGWVQSYGSRYVKPPIIFGDVSRPRAMTTYWSEYAQSITKRPMKGMLTGPITMLQWSFVRDDQPRSETANQIALAIRDEVVDLEGIGLAAIQIDEPALREGLPLRRSDWAAYLDWAVKAFRLCASGVRDETQIHTHMCYAEFNDIIQSIADLDADVITIETSRSKMELLNAFVSFKYPNEIGPGVYDIHSPRIPAMQEMEDLVRKAESVIPARNIWVNPDCGLKTRGWDEVKPALVNMVECANKLREELSVGA
ncbi:MAG: 5-methyltetrahydropteroyltriglutamate--homocysteine S-methyltransferase [Chloroflexota bacterium]